MLNWKEEIDAEVLSGEPEAVALIRKLWYRNPTGEKVIVRRKEWVIYDFDIIRDTVRRAVLMAHRGDVLVTLYVEVAADWRNGDPAHVSRPWGYRISDLHNYRLLVRQERRCGPGT